MRTCLHRKRARHSKYVYVATHVVVLVDGAVDEIKVNVNTKTPGKSF